MKLILAPLAVFAVALIARAAVAAAISFPIPEDSAYYVTAARNLAEGRGLVTDVLWSYATPPLTLPRPAFDLWQPLASLITAPVMAIFGSGLASAQATSVLLGALAAPLAWAIGRDAAREISLPPARLEGVGLTAGLAIALTPLLVVQGAEPDSSAPFTLLALAAAWLIPRAMAERGPGWRWRVLVGATLGLAYLARQEAVYLAVAYLGLAWLADRREGLIRTVPAIAVGALAVAPWLLRQMTTWQGSPLGQLLENAWLARPEDVFAWSVRPSLATHLAIGPPALIGLRLDALAGNVGLLVVLGFPAGLLGLAALTAWPRLLTVRALRPLAIAAFLILLVDTLVFPVASLAGLFAHGAGPILALLAVAGGLGLDRAIERVAVLRRWGRPNVVLGPILVVLLALPVAALAATLERQRAVDLESSYAELAASSREWDLAPGAPVVTDHPMWTSLALGRPALVLPRGNAGPAGDLARHFGAGAFIVRDEDIPDAFLFDLIRMGGRRPTWCFAGVSAPEPFRVLVSSCPVAVMETSPPPHILAGR